MLLERGAKVDKKNDKNQTPLAGVCFKGYTDMAKLLLEYGANPDIDNGMGLTPMNCACMFRHKDIIPLLLKKSKKKLTLMQKISMFLMCVKDIRRDTF
ncbi:ankyrin repeat domain-containing protein, partial [uncultured Helicobacter sp.]